MEEKERPEAKSRNLKTSDFALGLVCIIWLLNPNVFLFGVIVSIPVIGLIITGLSHRQLNLLIRMNADPKDYNVPGFIMFPTLAITLILVFSYDIESWKGLLPATLVFLLVPLGILFFLFKIPNASPKKILNATWPTIFFLFLFSYFTAYGTNVYLDTSAPELFPTIIISKEESRGKGKSTRRTYYALVEPWGNFTEPKTVMISKSDFESINPGDTLGIERQRGYLGVYWFKPIWIKHL